MWYFVRSLISQNNPGGRPLLSDKESGGGKSEHRTPDFQSKEGGEMVVANGDLNDEFSHCERRKDVNKQHSIVLLLKVVIYGTVSAFRKGADFDLIFERVQAGATEK